MSHKKLAEIVVRYIEFLELADEKQLDTHTAVNALESIAADFAEATPEEQLAVKQAAKEGIYAFQNRKLTHVPGLLNRVGGFFMKLLPKKLIIGQMSKVYEKALVKAEGKTKS